ncbi:MAG: ECF transporter S component [Galactobacter sp.]|uniref:ECF transporter S component n=1 Tax=Galactobacter sp. TaxID=2676125 RepID=UPI0025C10942|nr:ECF transporter S component [Galactobacter sp.]
MTDTSTSAPIKVARWRTVDIVVAAVLAVAGGVIFAVVNWADHLWDPVFVGFPPLSGLKGGLWLFPGVLAGLVVRRPGAGLFVEIVAAVISAVFGSSWGATVLLSGLIQGAGAELGVALAGGYKRFGIQVGLLAGALTGFACGINDAFIANWYPEYSTVWKWAYVGSVTLSGLVIGLLMWFATRGLAATGALSALRSRSANREPLLG